MVFRRFGIGGEALSCCGILPIPGEVDHDIQSATFNRRHSIGDIQSATFNRRQSTSAQLNTPLDYSVLAAVKYGSHAHDAPRFGPASE
jgi:hypothetical protein